LKRYDRVNLEGLQKIGREIKFTVNSKMTNIGPTLAFGRDGDTIDVKSYKAVTLDVTAMVAYTSNTSNGNANYIFQDKFLTDQAEWEREKSVKETIENYWEGIATKLICNKFY